MSFAEDSFQEVLMPYKLYLAPLPRGVQMTQMYVSLSVPASIPALLRSTEYVSQRWRLLEQS